MRYSIRSGVKELINLLWQQATPFVRRRLLLVLVLIFAAAILSALGPVALKLMVDAFTSAGPPRPSSIGLAAGLYVLSQWLAPSLDQLRTLVYTRAERRMFTALSDSFFGHVLNLPMRFHVERATGAINQTLSNGLLGFQTILHYLVFSALPVVIQLAATLWIIWRIHQPSFLAIFCIAVLCYAMAFSRLIVRSAKQADEAATSLVEATALMTDSIMAAEVVKYFAAENTVRSRVRSALTDMEGRWVRVYRGYALNGLTVAAIYAAFLALAIGVAAREVFAARMTVGEFVLINSYMLQMMQPIESFGYAMQGLSQGSAQLKEMLRLLQVPAEQPNTISNDQPNTDEGSNQSPRHRTVPASGEHILHPGCKPGSLTSSSVSCLTPRPASLEFRHVGLSYEADRPVLRNVSFALPAGRTLGVVGTSGAGKSTIVRLLVRLFEPDEGTILFDGMRTTELSLHELRHAIAVVPQDTILFNDTIRYNIAFGRSGCTIEEVAAAARLARLHEFIMSLPEQYETKVGERGVKLSGGEKQRVSIARAALKAPRLYVFDEATSSLDTATEREIVSNLRSVAASCTTVIIAHRLSTVVHADEIIVLEAGAIVERGAHAELLRRNQRYAALWDAQQSTTSRPTERAH